MDRINLVGSEEVRSAGHAMERAAQEMTHAASQISDALWRHQQLMEEWLRRLESIMNPQGKEMGE